MTDLSNLCAGLGLDEAACHQTLTRPNAADRHGPIYIQALLGLGAWIAAILMVAFVLTTLLLVSDWDPDESGTLLAVIGALLLLGGAAMQRAVSATSFGHHFAGALTTAGVLLLPLGIGLETESFWPASAAAGLAALACILISRDRAAQFVATAAALALVAVGFLADSVPHMVSLAALAAALGVAVTVYPPRLDVRPAATALLIFMPCLTAVLGSADEIAMGLLSPPAPADGWVARGIQIGLFLWLLQRHLALSPRPLSVPVVAGVAAACIAVVLLLPPGGAAALTLMMLGFVLGLRGIALLGVLFQVYFVVRFYYDLGLPLLEKSLLLAAVGVVLLGAYALIARRAEPAS